MPKNKLKPGFDPVWQSDFLDLRRMSKSAFILRQIYRLNRDPATNLVNLSDYTIRAITGWHLRTIKRARRQLILLKEITPQGYHNFQVNPFHQFKSIAESATPNKSNSGTKCHAGMAQNAIDSGTKCHTGMAQTAPPYNTDLQTTDIQICKNCENFEGQHLDIYGNKTSWCPKMMISPLPHLNAQDCQFYQPVPHPAESEAAVEAKP